MKWIVATVLICAAAPTAAQTYWQQQQQLNQQLQQLRNQQEIANYQWQSYIHEQRLRQINDDLTRTYCRYQPDLAMCR